jgi:hypothetical protein
MCLHPTPVQSGSQHTRLSEQQFLSSFWFDKKDRFFTAYASIGRYYFDIWMLEQKMIEVVFDQRVVMILTLIALWWTELGCQFLLLFLPFGRPLAWQFTIIMVFLHLDFRFDHLKRPLDSILIVGSRVWGHFLLFQSQNFEYQNCWPHHILVDSPTGFPALQRVSSNFTDEVETIVFAQHSLYLAWPPLRSRFGWGLSVPIVILKIQRRELEGVHGKKEKDRIGLIRLINANKN